MPEPVKDLPDPLEETPKSEASNPDDLIAQMAEQAIDDMIAEADREGPTERAPLPEEPPLPEDAPAAAVTPAAPVPPTEGLQSQLDNLFTTLDSEPDPAPKSETPAPEPEHVEDPAAEITPAVPEPAIPEPVNEPPEPRADVRALLDDAVHSAPRFGTPRVVIKLLELINSPFADLPDGVRDTLGQIAIITLVNALAVLLYVILFRN